VYIFSLPKINLRMIVFSKRTNVVRVVNINMVQDQHKRVFRYTEGASNGLSLSESGNMHFAAQLSTYFYVIEF
jgi:hypothetical protein